MDGINLFQQFVASHQAQLEASAVPQHLWHTLHRKLAKETFDAGEHFQLMLVDYEEEEHCNADRGDINAGHIGKYNVKLESRPVFVLCVARENGIQADDPSAIYLIDHAWTFRMENARQQLQQNEHLLDRLCAITGTDLEDDQRLEKILKRIWKYCQSYTFINENGSDDINQQPIWYIMDEVGSAVWHSEEGNFRLVPFIHLNTQFTYSLLFPIKDCEYGEQVVRDFLEYVPKNATDRVALSIPWCYTDLSDESFRQTEPDEHYFTTGHVLETYPEDSSDNTENHNVNCFDSVRNRSTPLKVYTEYDVLASYLNLPSSFVLTDNKDEADILWLTKHFKEFDELARNTPTKFINQFPFEYVITIKDLLSIICRRAAVEHHNEKSLQTYPVWLPTTYNLKTELLEFVSYYQNRANRCLDNHWIIKPWNLARGLDICITDNLMQIVRLPVTGPKIAQKYIERPVLFYRTDLDAKVKFDVRYVIILKSVRPLVAYVDRKFYLRFCNKAFELDNFDDYEQHFTVMNYRSENQMYHLKCEEFQHEWQQQYPEYDWQQVEDDICQMLYEMLECATSVAPPCGIAKCAQSRAIYAADIILDWTDIPGKAGNCKIQPKLLEVNWTPDCQRTCIYYPQFFNDIFKLLFLNEIDDNNFRLLNKV